VIGADGRAISWATAPRTDPRRVAVVGTAEATKASYHFNELKTKR
jgi:LPS sulfotransferase NodH